MPSAALRMLVRAAAIAQAIMGAARLSRSGRTGTCGLCDRCVMRTVGLGGFWVYCLDGKCSFSGHEPAQQSMDEQDSARQKALKPPAPSPKATPDTTSQTNTPEPPVWPLIAVKPCVRPLPQAGQFFRFIWFAKPT